MIRYVDASALVKIYNTEPESGEASELLAGEWTSGRHTRIEVRRALSRGLEGRALETARARFDLDWRSTAVVELDRRVCERAVALAEDTGARTLDALHLAAADAAGAQEGLPIVTFDRRLANTARALGWIALGA